MNMRTLAPLALLAFAVLIGRGLSIAADSSDHYGLVLAAGLTINFAVYATINMAVALGLMPTTGLPLPFISYGGSALIANMIAAGIPLGISRQRSGGILLRGRFRGRTG